MSVSAPTYIYPPLDANPNDLYQGFVNYMQGQIPGWQPYSGELDDWLARAFAGIQASLTEIASDVATQIYRWFGANIVNVPPYNAVAATGLVTITVQDAAGYTIPAYTQMSFPDTSGNLQGFETIADVTIASGQTSATGVFVQAMTPGSAGNGCSGAGSLDSSTPITYITGLTMTNPSSQGADAETDAAYLNRLTALFTTLTPTPITATDFTIIAANQSGVGRAITLSAFNPANWTTTGTTAASSNQITAIPSTTNIPVGATISGTGIPANTYVTQILSSTSVQISQNATAAGTGVTLTIGGETNQGGNVTTWVVDSNGNPLTSAAMATIQSTIQAECLTNVNYYVEAPTTNTVNVTATVVAWPGVSTSSVQSAVQSAIQNFLEPNNFGQNRNPAVSSGQAASSWLNDTYVRVVVLENVIMNVAGVHYVSSVQINGVAADLALNGIVPITEPGTITVTVTNG